MKTVTEIILAVVILLTGASISPKAIRKFKNIAIQKVDRGLPSLGDFANKLTER